MEMRPPPTTHLIRASRESVPAASSTCSTVVLILHADADADSDDDDELKDSLRRVLYRPRALERVFLALTCV